MRADLLLSFSVTYIFEQIVDSELIDISLFARGPDSVLPILILCQPAEGPFSVQPIFFL